MQACSWAGSLGVRRTPLILPSPAAGRMCGQHTWLAAQK